MSTLDTVFLIITACSISLFFLLGSVLTIGLIKLVKNVKQVVAKAENTIESVGEATAVLKNIGNNAEGPMAALKVVRNIIKLVNRK